MGMERTPIASRRESHPTATEISAWLDGRLADAETDCVQNHLILCEECRAHMVLLRQAIRPQPDRDQGPDFDRLLQIGEEAARMAHRWWEEIRPPSTERGWLRWFAVFPAWRWVTLGMAILAAGIPSYYYYQRNQPVERAMRSLRMSWTQSRPLEGRVTGGFPYLPYLITRSNNEKPPVNQDFLTLATAVLAKEVVDDPSPRTQHALGKLQLLKGEFELAEPLLTSVLQREPRNAQAHVDLAVLVFERAVRTESLSLMGQAADRLKAATEIDPDLPEAWFNLALCHEQMMLLYQAQSDWERFLMLDKDSPWAAEAREHLEKLRNRVSFYSPAKSTAKMELLQAGTHGDKEKVRILVSEKFSEITSVAWDQLLDEYIESIVGGRSPDTGSVENTMRMIAQTIYDEKGDHFFTDQWGFVFATIRKYPKQIENLRQNLANAEMRYRDGDYIRAAASYESARHIAESIGDQCHREFAMYGMTKIYTPQTETVRIAALRQQLPALAARHRHLQVQARSLASLANVYGAQQKISPAMRALSQANEIARTIGDSDCSAYALRNMVAIYTYVGQADAAFTSGHTLLKLLRQHRTNLRNSCAAYADMAERFAGSNSYVQAIDFQLEALRFCEQGDKAAYVYEISRAADYYSRNDQQERAAQLLSQAIKIAGEYSTATNMHTMSFALNFHLGEVLLRQQKGAQAEAAFLMARRLLSDSGPKRFFAAIFHGLARAYMQQQRVQEAENAMTTGIQMEEQALNHIDEAGGKSSYLQNHIDIYRTMVELQYFHKNDYDLAFDFAEKYRSRELLELLAAKSSQIGAASPEDSHPMPLRSIRQEIPEQAQVLAFTFTERHLLLWFLSSQNQLHKSVPMASAKVHLLVEEFLKTLYRKEAGERRERLSEELYEMLISPLSGSLRPDHTLVIIPDGILQALPFSALVSPQTKRYLIEDYDISYTPSLNILGNMKRLSQGKRASLSGSLLVVSNPKFDSQVYPALHNLRGAEEEGAALQAFYPISRQLAREQATKQALLSQIGNYEVVHVAAHTIVNERTPLKSRIVLARREPSETTMDDLSLQHDSDALEAQELFNMNLERTRLVILSSCFSTTSEQFSRNSFGTFAHAFFSARVPTVIDSLWEVEDKSTAAIMKLFHAVYRREKIPISQALRKAQLALLYGKNEAWRHPYYWSAFRVIGDGRMI